MYQTIFYFAIFMFVVTGLSFSDAYADSQVIIPLGASSKEYPFSLSPAVLNIGLNDTVTWKNQDNTVHTVTTGKVKLGYDGRIDSGSIQPGTIFSYKFTKSGVYEYFCLFHPWMTGLVNVGDGSQVGPTTKITIASDKSSYQDGDTILISGEVSKFIPNEIVTVWITDEHGKIIATSHVETENGSKFTAEFKPGGGLWALGNNYVVFAQYGFRSSVAATTISFGPQNQQIVKSNESDIQPTGNESNISISSNLNGTSHFTSHKIVNANSNYFITVQTNHYIYRPGELVHIQGTVWDGVFQKLGGAAYLETIPSNISSSSSVSEVITIRVKDTEGNIVLNQAVVAGLGGYYSSTFKIPQESMTGKYTAEAIIQTKAGLSKALDSSISSKLDSSADFAISKPSQYVVKTASGDLSVEIESNSTVSNFDFKSGEKKILFSVQGNNGTKGVTMITIPKNLLSGNLQVFNDGNLESNNSDSVFVTSDNNVNTTLEINYHHSSHTIEVVGTMAAKIVTAKTETVPEFGSTTAIILVVSVSSIIAISAKYVRFV